MDGAERRVSTAFARAGVEIGGAREWDLHVHDQRLFRRVLARGMMGLGDSYVDGWWDSPQVDQLFDRALRADLPAAFARHPLVRWECLRQRLFNRQRRTAARLHVERHYHLGHDLFEAMLDRRMTYSCGYWHNAATLDEAQEAKLELVCRKIGLRPGQRVLDIGCGWGSFASYAAERHGAHVVGITLSAEQVTAARERCRGLPVEIRLQDYRDVRETFDHVVSIGMFEHVGHKNHRAFMLAARRCLTPRGLLLLHAFGTVRAHPDPRDSEVMWIERRIFPGMEVPSMARIGRALDGLFVAEDVHNFGADYDPTLMTWHDNFERAWQGGRLRGRYDERFRRMWRYYLLSCAGAFRSRKYQVWQFVLSPTGVPAGWRERDRSAEPTARPPRVVVRPDPLGTPRGVAP